jgi:hypothetical protein
MEVSKRRIIQQFIEGCHGLDRRTRRELLNRLTLIGQTDDNDELIDQAHIDHVVFDGHPLVAQEFWEYLASPAGDPGITDAIERSSRMG